MFQLKRWILQKNKSILYYKSAKKIVRSIYHLVYGGMKMKSEYNIPLELEGINKTIYEWAVESSLLMTFMGKGQNSELLLKVLGKDAEQRELASLTLYQQLWAKYPEFGPNLLINMLPEFEHDRVFYNNYRDHTTHMVKCFLLGIYLYENCSVFFGAVKDIQRFLKTWTLVALYHDIGYILENDVADPQEEYSQKIWNMINNTLQAPLSNVSIFSGEISVAEEKKIIKKFFKRGR